MIRGRKSPVVHVIAFRKNADSPIQLTVTPDPLDMTEFVRGDHIITWKLDTKGFRFPTDIPAIEFTSPGSECSFSGLKVEKGERRVTVHNKNKDGLAFAYNVNVIEASSGLKAFLDPVIQNQNE